MSEQENMLVPVTAHSEKCVMVADDDVIDLEKGTGYEIMNDEVSVKKGGRGLDKEYPKSHTDEADKLRSPSDVDPRHDRPDPFEEKKEVDIATGGGESAESNLDFDWNKIPGGNVPEKMNKMESTKAFYGTSTAEAQIEKVTTLEQLNEARQKYAEEIAKSRSMKSRAKKLVAKLGIKRFDQSNDDEALLVESAKLNYGKTLEGYKKAVAEKIDDAENVEAQKNLLLENTEILAKEGIQLDEDIVNKRAERLGMLVEFGEKLHGVTKWWNGLGKKGWIKGKIPRMFIGGGVVALSGGALLGAEKGFVAGAAGMGTYDALKTGHDEADEKKVQSSFDSLMKEKGISADDSEFIEMMKTEVLEKYDLKTVESERVRKEKERRNRVIAGATVFAGTLAWGKLFSDYGGDIKDYVGEKVGVVKDFYGNILSGDEVTGSGVSQGVGSEVAGANNLDTNQVKENLPQFHQEAKAGEITDWNKVLVDDNLVSEEVIAPEIHEVKVNVKSGDNIWKIIEDKLDGSGKFEGMNEAQKTHFIDDLKDDFANMSEAQRTEIGFKRPDDIGFIVPNQELDLSSVLGNDSIIEQARVDALGLSEGQISSIESNLAGGGNVPSENPIVQPESVIENSSEIPVENTSVMEDVPNVVDRGTRIISTGPFSGFTMNEFSFADEFHLPSSEYGVIAKEIPNMQTLVNQIEGGLIGEYNDNQVDLMKALQNVYRNNENIFGINTGNMKVGDFINYMTSKNKI